MPSLYDPHATYWIEVPGQTLNNHPQTYYYPYEGGGPSVYEPPKVPWDQLWVIGVHLGRPYFFNRTSRQTVWEIPGIARGKVGSWKIHRDRRPHEWDFHMVAINPGQEAGLYDPDVSPDAALARSEVARQEGISQAVSWVPETDGAQAGEVRAAHARNCKAGQLPRALSPDAALLQAPRPAAAAASGARAGGEGKETEEEEEEVLADSQLTLPGFMSTLSVVRLARLPLPLQRFEGRCVTVEHHDDDGQVRFHFPELFGPESFKAKPGWLAPLRPGMWATLANLPLDLAHREGGCITIMDFNPFLHQYMGRTHDGLVLPVESWQLKPFVPLRGMSLRQPQLELTWKKLTEQNVTYVDRAGSVHNCAVHLPLGWEAWKRRKERRPWPLLVHLHGNGGNGNMFHMTRKSVKSQGLKFAAETFVVVSPTCRWNWKQDPQGWVAEMVDSLRACQWIDSDRIYLAGCSMGGMGTWMIGAQRPDLFAAIAPVASYYKPEHEASIASRLANMPIVVAASAQDGCCHFGAEVPLYKRLLSLGCTTLQVFLHENADHCSMWDKAFSETDFLYRWLLAHSRGSHVSSTACPEPDATGGQPIRGQVVF